MTLRWVLSIGLVLACLAPQSADALSPRGRGYLRNMQVAMRNVKKDLKLFDGKAIVAGASRSRLESLKRTIISNLNRALRYWNRLSAGDRRDAQVRKVGATIDERTHYAKALEKAMRSMGKASAAADKACRDFEKEAMKSVKRKRMVSLVWLLGDKGKVTYTTAEQVSETMAAAKKIAAFCAKPKYKGVGKVGCRWMKISGRDRDPSAWCEAAAKAKSLVAQGVMNFAAHKAKVGSRLGPDPDKLAKRDGWLMFEGPVTYKSHLYFGEAAKKRLLDKLGPMFKAAGMDGAKDPKLWASQKAAVDTLRAKVDELAPSWKPYRTVGKSYGCRHAKRIIKKWHRKARIKKVGLKYKKWNIRKNALKRPIDRSRQGVIIFKIPGEKWCQARSWVITEKYKGGGRYAKAKGVAIGYVRFQKGCR